jgi:hypothetical protein
VPLDEALKRVISRIKLNDTTPAEPGLNLSPYSQPLMSPVEVFDRDHDALACTQASRLQILKEGSRARVARVMRCTNASRTPNAHALKSRTNTRGTQSTRPPRATALV